MTGQPHEAAESPMPAPGRTIRVLCVDDSPDVAGMLKVIISAEPGMECVGCLGSADHLLAEAQRLSPDVVILDATMPGKDAFVALQEVSASLPTVRVVIYSGHDDPDFVQSAIDAGAWGCLSKLANPGDIPRSVREVASGQFVFPRSFGGR